MRRVIRLANAVLAAFVTIIVVIAIGAHSPYVPNSDVLPLVFKLATLAFLVGCLAVFVGAKNPDGSSRGISVVKEWWAAGKRLKLIKILVSIPVFCALIGYVVAALAVTAPALPTKYLSHVSDSSHALCVRSGRDKVRGSWSLLKLESGELWKVAGVGRFCEAGVTRNCEVYYRRGEYGNYVDAIHCS